MIAPYSLLTFALYLYEHNLPQKLSRHVTLAYHCHPDVYSLPIEQRLVRCTLYTALFQPIRKDN